MQKTLPIVIAHRGASGYLPEHTLEGTIMAYAMGADFIEPDLVLTRDNIPIILHDIYLEYTTNVQEVFPQKVQSDGHWYAIDLTLSEIKTLSVHERTDEKGQVIYPQRFPVQKGSFTIPTLSEQIERVQGLNTSTGREIGLYPELKEPLFHEKRGYDLGKTVLAVLKQYGYHNKKANLFLQCFEPSVLQKLRFEEKSSLPMIQLLGPNEWNIGPDYEAMLMPSGLKTIAQYADGIGLWLYQIQDERDHYPSYVVNPHIVHDAHQAGLQVHVYTFRKDELPKYAHSFKALLRIFLSEWKVEGVFTDFPDLVVDFRKTHFAREHA
ncbi:MAG: glycerophosphodiester phosphodiesterase [Gammaproteobacteria bacterium]|nr:glycerophosphodiester phosphodiesterase [Gammaproteobacteria bacterium]